MPLEMRAMASSLVAAGRALSPAWQAALVRLGAVWAVLLAIFASDWAAMARQWWDISTYNHIVLIPAILAWLVWQRWPELQKLEPKAWWPGLALFAGAAFLWLLGAISGLDLARQAGVVAMLGAAVPLLLGVRVAAGLVFPLAYLVFLVPVGEELINVLQMITAEITIALTHLSGIPAVIDGVFIDTPAGLFEVAEACSGVKFLIAMVAFGVLAANVCFVSWRRRAAMLVACVIVPIVANGIRAWGTIYAAQIFGVEVAAGFDHIVYGWFFFAIVLALVIVGAWRFFDRPTNVPMIDVEAIRTSPWLGRLEAKSVSAGKALVALAVVLIATRSWAFAAETLEAPMPSHIDLPQVPGWTRVDYSPRIWWEPRAEGAEHRLLGRYQDEAGRQVDVFIALYSRQGEGHEAGGFGQGALMPESPWSWQSPGPAFGAGKSDRLLGNGTVERVAVTWYRNGDLLSGSNARLKLAVIADHLLFRARPTATLILSAEDMPQGTAGQAIARFRASTGPLGPWMDRMTGVR
ncbi:exosortase A [Novosphingobium mangrovi (ex Huang et al. 2023)]|uniref:Exosortase A n=1 Tax=Novosphingobium mangrovi (ex Huang et al. 2023) TaxID=2976432 RepID=A0ABT2I596_9SPHN|nr:exosortase A [Novosphingobium mangrovi (ex Huang et al. 2023)]MCT2399984.1 exosortase A [Novosphingobium mangrovi (ex Huang et al. 2023)]